MAIFGELEADTFLSEPQRSLKSWIDGLAVCEGGITEDVVRHAIMDLPNGNGLMLEVLDPMLVLGEPAQSADDLMYCATILGPAGEELEGVYITEIFSRDADFLNGEPEEPGGLRDEKVIEFMHRAGIPYFE